MLMRMIAVLLLSVSAIAQTAHYRHHGPALLPDAKVTPGAALKGCTVATICAPSYRSSTVRKTIKNFPKLKREVCAAYGAKKCDGTIEADHLVSIEICGDPSSLRNIWPQPYSSPGARQKDVIENRLHKLVCARKMSLNDAQTCIENDWVSCAERVTALYARLPDNKHRK